MSFRLRLLSFIISFFGSMSTLHNFLKHNVSKHRSNTELDNNTNVVPTSSVQHIRDDLTNLPTSHPKLTTKSNLLPITMLLPSHQDVFLDPASQNSENCETSQSSHQPIRLANFDDCSHSFVSSLSSRHEESCQVLQSPLLTPKLTNHQPLAITTLTCNNRNTLKSTVRAFVANTASHAHLSSEAAANPASDTRKLGSGPTEFSALSLEDKKAEIAASSRYLPLTIDWYILLQGCDAAYVHDFEQYCHTVVENCAVHCSSCRDVNKENIDWSVKCTSKMERSKRQINKQKSCGVFRHELALDSYEKGNRDITALWSDELSKYIHQEMMLANNNQYLETENQTGKHFKRSAHEWIRFHLLVSPVNIGLSKGNNILCDVVKPYRYVLNIEDDWILLPRNITNCPVTWLSTALAFMNTHLDVSTLFLRKYATEQEKWQYGWSRNIPYMSHRYANENFNWRNKIKHESKESYELEGILFQHIPYFLFTFNPAIRRNQDYYDATVYPLQEFEDVNNRQGEWKQTKEDTITKWGWCEALAMERHRSLKTFNFQRGCFGHFEDWAPFLHQEMMTSMLCSAIL